MRKLLIGSSVAAFFLAASMAFAQQGTAEIGVKLVKVPNTSLRIPSSVVGS